MYRQPASVHGALHPMYLRSVVGGAKPVAGLSLAPEIPVKKLQGAQSFAQVTPTEQPLALVDTSIMQSGKSGLLLTDRAAYFDSPRLRVPLEAITQLPVAGSANNVAHLPTAMGTVTLPSSATDESRDAMLRVLRAAALANRGATRFFQSHAPVHGLIGELASATLRSPSLRVAPVFVSDAVHAASNVAHTWLDHDSGETLLCFVDDTVSLDGTRGLAFTDRRLISFGDKAFDLPYSALLGASMKGGVLNSTIQLATQGGPVSVELLAEELVTAPIMSFLQGLGAIASGQRHAAHLPARSADDPSGVRGAMRALTQPDLRAATLLDLVQRAVAQSLVSADAGFDFAQRALRLHHCLREGHGRTGVMQRSPLSAADLCAVLTQLLGAPVTQRYEANGVLLDYDLARSGSAAGTIASNVVGIALLAVVGVGWVTTGSGGGVRSVRARVWEGPSGAGFSLTETSGAPLAKRDAKLASALLSGLASLSASALLRRVINGWSAPMEQLLLEPPESLDARARAVSPETDLAVFFTS